MQQAKLSLWLIEKRVLGTCGKQQGNPSALLGDEWSVSGPGLLKPWRMLITKLDGPQNPSRRFREEEILLSLQEFILKYKMLSAICTYRCNNFLKG